MTEGKKFFRCTVCNDIHFGAAWPSPCPTCKAENAYVEVDAQEARNLTSL